MRGTSNGNVRGSSYDRRTRRAWLMRTYTSNIEGYVRCYRCGCLLYNPDVVDPGWAARRIGEAAAFPLTADRIIPGCQGGTYRRTNIRPACASCNSETGGSLGAQRRRKT